MCDCLSEEKVVVSICYISCVSYDGHVGVRPPEDPRIWDDRDTQKVRGTSDGDSNPINSIARVEFPTPHDWWWAAAGAVQTPSPAVAQLPTTEGGGDQDEQPAGVDRRVHFDSIRRRDDSYLPTFATDAEMPHRGRRRLDRTGKSWRKM